MFLNIYKTFKNYEMLEIIFIWFIMYLIWLKFAEILKNRNNNILLRNFGFKLLLLISNYGKNFIKISINLGTFWVRFW